MTTSPVIGPCRKVRIAMVKSDPAMVSRQGTCVGNRPNHRHPAYYSAAWILPRIADNELAGGLRNGASLPSAPSASLQSNHKLPVELYMWVCTYVCTHTCI